MKLCMLGKNSAFLILDFYHYGNKISYSVSRFKWLLVSIKYYWYFLLDKNILNFVVFPTRAIWVTQPASHMIFTAIESKTGLLQSLSFVVYTLEKDLLSLISVPNCKMPNLPSLLGSRSLNDVLGRFCNFTVIKESSSLKLQPHILSLSPCRWGLGPEDVEWGGSVVCSLISPLSLGVKWGLHSMSLWAISPPSILGFCVCSCFGKRYRVKGRESLFCWVCKSSSFSCC